MISVMILEYLGTFMFAMSGAYVAIEEKFDLFGIFVIAAVTAMGGGVLRDTVIDVGVPAFFTSYFTLPFIFLGAIIVIALRGKIKYQLLFTAIDAVGLAAFAVSAGMKMMDAGYNAMVVLFAVCVTGCGGGMLRDIAVNRKPAIFKHDIYAIAAIVGGIVLLIFDHIIGRAWAVYISLLIIIVLRMVCYIKGINLPTMETLYGKSIDMDS